MARMQIEEEGIFGAFMLAEADTTGDDVIIQQRQMQQMHPCHYYSCPHHHHHHHHQLLHVVVNAIVHPRNRKVMIHCTYKHISIHHILSPGMTIYHIQQSAAAAAAAITSTK